MISFIQLSISPSSIIPLSVCTESISNLVCVKRHTMTRKKLKFDYINSTLVHWKLMLFEKYIIDDTVQIHIQGLFSNFSHYNRCIMEFYVLVFFLSECIKSIPIQ